MSVRDSNARRAGADDQAADHDDATPAGAGKSKEDHPYAFTTADGKTHTSATLVGTHVAIGDDVLPVVGAYQR